MTDLPWQDVILRLVWVEQLLINSHIMEPKLSSFATTSMNTLKPTNAADEAGVKDVMDEAIRLYGRLDVFFANAAVGGTWKTVFDTTVAEF